MKDFFQMNFPPMRALKFITGHVIYNSAYTCKFQPKIVIAGNHELSFDQKFRDKMETNAQNINAPESVEAPFSPRYA